jgi:hypothetical protein
LIGSGIDGGWLVRGVNRDGDICSSEERAITGSPIEKLAVVLWELMLAKVTVPGPLNLDQVRVRVLLVGNPSSVATPLRFAEAGRVIV